MSEVIVLALKKFAEYALQCMPYITTIGAVVAAFVNIVAKIKASDTRIKALEDDKTLEERLVAADKRNEELSSELKVMIDKIDKIERKH